MLKLAVKLSGATDPPAATSGQPFAVISTTAGFQAVYDHSGNMTRRVEGGVVYTQTFDAENRLVSVATVTGTTAFVYDGNGNRVKRVEGVTTTVYLGSVSLATNGSGLEIPGSRTGYDPYGNIRYGGNGLPAVKYRPYGDMQPEWEYDHSTELQGRLRRVACRGEPPSQT
jgi:YD repeat-containing protein